MDEQTADIVVKSLETEPVKNLLNPVTKELGLLAGDLAGLVRFYVNLNLDKIFQKWARQREDDDPLRPDQVQKVIPLLQAASLQSDEELQERWAALLQSTVTNETRVLPSFGQTLAQLNAKEAKFFDHLYSLTVAKDGTPHLGDMLDIVRMYLSFSGVDIEKTSARPEAWVEASLTFRDLERLCLIGTGELPQGNSAKKYNISEYGLAFIEAITP